MGKSPQGYDLFFSILRRSQDKHRLTAQEVLEALSNAGVPVAANNRDRLSRQLPRTEDELFATLRAFKLESALWPEAVKAWEDAKLGKRKVPDVVELSECTDSELDGWLQTVQNWWDLGRAVEACDLAENLYVSTMRGRRKVALLAGTTWMQLARFAKSGLKH